MRDSQTLAEDGPTETKRENGSKGSAREGNGAQPQGGADAPIKYLPPALQRTLGLLVDAPEDIAELTLVTLPYEGSLRTLEELKMIELEPQAASNGVLGRKRMVAADEAEAAPELLELKLTDLGRETIKRCASLIDHSAEMNSAYENLIDPDSAEIRVKPA